MIEILLQAENSLQLGLLEQAERRYWQVLESDPANAIAIVGLGRVALERSDERTALAFGRKALGVDPENSVARRLVGRLEEVIRERGDVVPVAAPDLPTSPRPGDLRPGDLQRADLPPADLPPADTPLAALPPAERADPSPEQAGAHRLPGSAAPAPSPEPAPRAEPSSSSEPSAPPQPSAPPAARARRGLLDRLLRRP